MKKLLVFAALFCFFQTSFAQHYLLQPTGATGPTGTAASDVYQDGSGLIGVSNAAPSANLEVTGASASSGSVSPVMVSSYTPGYTVKPDYFIARNSEYIGPPINATVTTNDFVIKGDGKVGIGTATPLTPFMVQSHVWLGSGVTWYNNAVMSVYDDSWGYPIFDVANTGTSSHPGAAIGLMSKADQPALEVVTDVNSPVFELFGNGTLGIGTFTPAAQLDIIKNNTAVNYLLHVSDGSIDNFSIHNDGYVGIGELNTGDAQLEIGRSPSANHRFISINNGSPTGTTYFTVKEAGVGIGTDDLAGMTSTLIMKGAGSNGTALDMLAKSGATGVDDQIRFAKSDETVRHVITDDYSSNNLIIHPGVGGGANPIVFIEGRMRIGTDEAKVNQGSNYSNYQLSVDGQIVAKEVVVETANWQDSVFSSTYSLQPLNKVEEYIKTNHHLPGVPSEKEVIANGISLGEMNKILMQKVEELTLYLLEMKTQDEKLANTLTLAKTRK